MNIEEDVVNVEDGGVLIPSVDLKIVYLKIALAIFYPQPAVSDVFWNCLLEYSSRIKGGYQVE